jgi:predicted nucleic acid-binding protein
MIRLTLDANAYISTLHFGGRAQRLLWMAEQGDIEITASEPILEEVFRVSISNPIPLCSSQRRTPDVASNPNELPPVNTTAWMRSVTC